MFPLLPESGRAPVTSQSGTDSGVALSVSPSSIFTRTEPVLEFWGDEGSHWRVPSSESAGKQEACHHQRASQRLGRRGSKRI